MTRIIRQLTGLPQDKLLAAAAEYGYSTAFLQQIIGSGEKKLAPAEKNNYGKTNRSLHYLKDMAAGTVLHAEDIGILRTEKNLSAGEPPDMLHHFIGAVLQNAVKSGDGATLGDIIARRNA